MKILPVLALSAALLGGTAFAANSTSTATASPTPSCKQQATQQKLKGEARVKFMKECKSTRH